MRKVLTYIAPSLYQAIVKEKFRLQAIENKKIKSRKNKITMVEASSSLARKIR